MKLKESANISTSHKKGAETLDFILGHHTTHLSRTKEKVLLKNLRKTIKKGF